MTPMIRLKLLSRVALLLIAIALPMLIVSCGGEIEGALLMKDIVLYCTAPNASAGTPGGQCDEYIAYYSTNPTDLKTKPLTALASVKALNRPAVAGQADSLRLRHLFPTGRTVYYKAVATKFVWLSPNPDTTKADSTLTVLASEQLSNFAWRYLPPEQNEKPTTPTISDITKNFATPVVAMVIENALNRPDWAARLPVSIR